MHLHLARFAGGHEIFEDAVHDVLVEAPGVSVRGEVKLQGLRLDAKPARNVADDDRCKIRLAGHRTHRGELRTVKTDPVIALREAVREGVQRARAGLRGVGGLGLSKETQAFRGGGQFLLRGHAGVLRGIVREETVFPFARARADR